MECHDIDAVDVLVCGAGSAGFCAAVQAARTVNRQKVPVYQADLTIRQT